MKRISEPFKIALNNKPSNTLKLKYLEFKTILKSKDQLKILIKLFSEWNAKIALNCALQIPGTLCERETRTPNV